MTVEEHVNLARFTSLHVGGPARYFMRAKNDEDLRQALFFARDHNVPFFVLGKGSNTVFPDSGFSGVVIMMEDRTITVEGTTITAAAGVFMRQFVNAALRNQLVGAEELAGIPGTIGGSIRGNAGTWQTEIKDILHSVHVLVPDASGWELRTKTLVECEFGYRDSIFKRQPDWIIVRGIFQLTRGDQATGEKLVQRDLEKRHNSQPYDAPSAGSVFKNPDKARGIFAGALIEQAGLKGTCIGGAQISTKHANFIVNRGRASSRDIQQLVYLAQRTVQKRTGIALEPEIVIVKSD